MSLSASSAPGSGVIHDIGYRRYDGPRLGRREIFTALFGYTLRGSYGIGRGVAAKIFPWFLVLCAVVPAFIIVAVASVTNADDLPVEYNAYTYFISMIPTLLVAVQAPQAVSRDMRFHSLPLYFSRPLSYTDYVRAKWAGLMTGMFAMLVAPLLVLYVGALLIEMPAWEATTDVLTAIVGVAIVAVLVSVLALVIASVTPRRGLGVAAVATFLVVLDMVTGIIQESIQEFSSNPDSAGWYGFISPYSLSDGILVFVFNAQPTDNGAPPPPTTGAGWLFIAAAIGIAGLGYLMLLARYRRVSRK